MISSALFVLSLTALSSVADAKCQKYVDAANAAAANLQGKYFHGDYGAQAIWIGAVDTIYLLALDELTGTPDNAGVINTVFASNQAYLDSGKSYDDVQWVSMAYQRAGNIDQAKKYYDLAAKAVDSTYCGGGLFWSDGRDYKNSITNELFMATSGYLHEATGDEKYLQNLKDTWAWVKGSKLRGANGLFNDGLKKDGSCDNNGETQWTYNQATLLVGLAYLAKSGDASAASDATKIANAMITNLSVDGGLREACEDANQDLCNKDQHSFKGITVFYLSWYLAIGGPDDGTKFSDFIKGQADRIMANAKAGEDGSYGSVWYKPAASNSAASAESQGSALGALVAAAQQNC